MVDLIGDLDATLGTIAADTLDRIAGGAERSVYLSTKRVRLTTRDGLARLDAALAAARARGCAVAVEAGNRKMRTAFACAGIVCDAGPERPASRRHVMIAHRTPLVPLRESA
ncbi:MAG: hypothetical protein NVSMB19_10120 [Vulcanimicrobiaceae bacterium]